jgi:hypothetical protein
MRNVALLSRTADVGWEFALAGQTYRHHARVLAAV